MATHPDAPSSGSHVDFAELFRTLVAGEHLSGLQARAAADAMLAGGASEAQIAGLLIGLRTKGETAAELAGLLEGLRAAALDVGVDAEEMGLIDTCGTGGDGSGSLNISTMAALVAAGAGARVCKHGNRAVSSSCGSADLLEALGIVVDLGPAGVATCLREAGIAFCLAPLFHPALRHAGPTRRSLGVPTAFNYLGPMANPAGVRRQVIGVNDPAMAERMAEVLAVTGTQRAMVVHGYPRLDELSTIGPTRVIELRDGRIERYTVTPGDLGLATVGLADLAGADVAAGVEATRALLAGESVPWREIVCLNAAAGLVVGELATDLADGLRLATDALDSGAAAGKLSRWVEVSREATDGR
ncbi:MAG: anthranilate phosphoribosyltransferase [bacterium]|nr:anthranilate phosphoribosyltransferase [bacterium]